MYDELVKGLRVCEEGEHCDLCPKWPDKQSGGMNVCQTALLKEAADAIEELSNIVHEYQKFDGFLASHGMFEQGPMIPIEPPKEES